ncbi:MAG: enoyl-CoA hydratase/isomerase family protein [Hyphomicrobiaceae bacterium]
MAAFAAMTKLVGCVSGMGDVVGRVEGRVGRITLDRPAALNALTLEMVDEIDALLSGWVDDPAVKLVVMDAAGGRAFCAGGDITNLYQCMKAGDFAQGLRFFRHEYRLDRLIARYPKPVVTLMHGIVIGGGVGVSAHASHRVVTDRTVLVLPECSIGLIPDVGTSLLLARAPGRMGECIGLTGSRLSGADCIAAGFADRFVPSDRLGELTAALVAEADVAVIERFAVEPGESGLAETAGAIDAAFGAETAGEIVVRLAAVKAEWAEAALEAIGKGSPMSLACALWAIRQARVDDTIEAALTNEYRFVTRALAYGDFQEGIRAVVIDKDRKPVWKDAGLDAIAPEAVAGMFANLDDGELNFDRSADA